MKGFQYPKKKKSKKQQKDLLKSKAIKINFGFLVYLFIFLIGLQLLFISFLFHKTQEKATLNVEANTQKTTVFPYFSGDLNLSAKAMIIYEPESRVVVFGKNHNFRFSPASTAKIMTAIVVLENYSLDRTLKVENIESVEGSNMNLVDGEEITVRNLLYGLLLPSANDAAYILAKNYVAGDGDRGEEAFIAEMNKKASLLKLKNTKFFDPAGYEDDNYTTAFELARLAAYAMKNAEFRQTVSTYQITVFDKSGLISHELQNLNELLTIPSVNGIKTGFTNEAGGVLVTSFNAQDKDFITVVLKSDNRFLDTREIITQIIEEMKLIFY